MTTKTKKTLLEQAATAIEGYRVASVKTFRGHEGESCLQGKLYRGKTLVAEWSESDSGGCMWVQPAPGGHWAEFKASIVALTLVWPDDGSCAANTAVDFEQAELIVAEMGAEELWQRSLRRMAKKHVVFRTPSDEPGSYRKAKVHTEAGRVRIVQAIQATFPVVEWLAGAE